MTKINLFDPYSVDDNQFMLAAHLPIGRAWENGFSHDSNIGKYLLGLACEFYRFEVLTSDIAKEMDIDQTNQLLIDWEKSVGIPDSCFSTDVSIESRRIQVEQKLGKFGGVQTKADFERVAAAFGIVAQVFYGSCGNGFSFPMTFPTVFINYADYKEESHTIIVAITELYTTPNTFALAFPIPFSSGPLTFLQCIYRKLAPANVEVVVLFAEEL